MRITFLQIVLSIGLTGSLLAKEAGGQDILEKRVTISVRDEALKQVIQDVSRQIHVKFSYSANSIRADRRISCSVINKTLKEFLDEVIRPCAAGYEVVDGQVVIFPLPEKTPPAAPAAQTALPVRVITGTVTNQQGEPLPNISVVVKGTASGVTTNEQGVFSIGVDDNRQGVTLLFSAVGYEPRELVLGESLHYTVQLNAMDQRMNQVVVVGYGNQRKRELTSAVSSVQGSDFRNIVTNNTLTAIAGLMPGVQVSQSSGRPGASPVVRIRGTGSLNAGNTPLIVVDGMPLNSSEDFNMINPADIESIDVLKDAASAAIYGSRGGNGVMIVTTKKGKKGGARISFDYGYSVQQVSKYIDMMDRDQDIALMKETSEQEWLRSGGDPSVPNGSRSIPGNPNNNLFNYPSMLDTPANLPNTNWQKEIFRNAPAANYQLAVRGGSDKILYYVSGNYFSQDGIIRSTDFKRYGLRANVEITPAKNIRVGINVAPGYSSENLMPTDGHWSSGGIINSALGMPPWLPPVRPDGYLGQILGYPELANHGLPALIASPLQFFDNPAYKNRVETARILGGAFVELTLIRDLVFRSALNADGRSQWTNFYSPSTIGINNVAVLTPSFPDPNPGNIAASHAELRTTNYSWDNTLTYTHRFGTDHRLTVLAGHSSQKYTQETATATGQAGSFSNDLVQYVTAASVITATADRQQWTLESYLARVNYGFRDKYLLSAAIRRDGSSRFARNNKWANFPSVSAAWILSEESFLKDSRLLSMLKLRGSYGVTGNFNIGNYASLSQLKQDNYILGAGTGAIASGIAPANLKNDDLSWETNRQTDLGLDIGLFHDRVSFSIDAYKRLTEGLLFSRPVPAIAGFASYLGNIGRVENQGFELDANVKALDKAVKLTLGFNFAMNKNKVLQLGESNAPILVSLPSGAMITEVGQPFGQYLGYKAIGVFRDAADVAKGAQWALGGSLPGDLKFQDMNGDGKIDAADRTLLGSNQPDFTYGFNGQLSYKNLDLSFAFQGVQGSEVILLSQRFWGVNSSVYNAYAATNDRWRSPEDPGNGKVQRAFTSSANTGGNTQFNSNWVYDGSFLRLRNLTLGYNFSEKLVRRVKLKSGRIYLSGQNLFTITKYIGYNPEVSYESGGELPTTAGLDYGVYPLARVFTIGISIGL